MSAVNSACPRVNHKTALLRAVRQRLGDYWRLIKSLQTGLLLATAVAGYASGCCLNPRAGSLGMLVGSLFLAVSGSTVLNMAFDRDIDGMMSRTARRPLPAGRVAAWEAWILGALLTGGGLLWAFTVDKPYAGVVALGVILDVLVYTIWLKRRTPLSILIGGLSGGMPALAGRVLAVGRVDEVGLLLAAGVLLWIPTHIMTFSIKYQADYERAGVPTFPSTYGVLFTRQVVAVSTLLAALVLFIAGRLLYLPRPLMLLTAALGAALLVLVVYNLARPSQKANYLLFKGASIYMLVTMALMFVGGI